MIDEKHDLRFSIVAILSGVFLASLSDAFIKSASTEFQLWQIFVLRSLITIPFLILIIKIWSPGTPLLPCKMGWTALRSLLLVLMWIALYAALPKVDLAVAGAVYYTLPLFITIFAALFVGEMVGISGWTAVAIGFAGVLLILKPQAEDFNIYALLPLISAICYALAMILTRTKIQSEEALVLSLGLNIAFVVIGNVATLCLVFVGISAGQVKANPYFFGEWASMDLSAWLTMAILAALITVGSLFATLAYQKGPSSIVSSFDFFYLAFIVFWGMIFFAEIPDAVSILGISLIACAGVLTTIGDRPRFQQ